MAECIDWYACNTLLKGNGDYIPDIKVYNNGKCSVSAWRLSREDLIQLINNDGVLFIGVLGGKSQSPMVVGTEDFVRRIVADTGPVWSKNKSLDDKVPK